eukprot:741327-Hanusia_phi.AAC.3
MARLQGHQEEGLNGLPFPLSSSLHSPPLLPALMPPLPPPPSSSFCSLLCFTFPPSQASEPIDGNEAVDIEYRYDLITSGPVRMSVLAAPLFDAYQVVGRHGFAKLVGLGSTVVALGATSVDTRFKGLKDELKTTTDSFRVHVVKQEFEKAR